MLVADSGSGKLGAMKVFSQEVTKIQKEEMAVYDQSASAKDPSPTKRMKKDPSTSPVFHKNCLCCCCGSRWDSARSASLRKPGCLRIKSSYLRAQEEDIIIQCGKHGFSDLVIRIKRFEILFTLNWTFQVPEIGDFRYLKLEISGA